MSRWVSGQFLLSGSEDSLEVYQDQALDDPGTDLLRATSQMLPLELGNGFGNLGF
jgi:hypothetical protein